MVPLFCMVSDSTRNIPFSGLAFKNISDGPSLVSFTVSCKVSPASCHFMGEELINSSILRLGTVIVKASCNGSDLFRLSFQNIFFRSS